MKQRIFDAIEWLVNGASTVALWIVVGSFLVAAVQLVFAHDWFGLVRMAGTIVAMVMLFALLAHVRAGLVGRLDAELRKRR